MSKKCCVVIARPINDDCLSMLEVEDIQWEGWEKGKEPRYSEFYCGFRMYHGDEAIIRDSWQAVLDEFEDEWVRITVESIDSEDEAEQRKIDGNL